MVCGRINRVAAQQEACRGPVGSPDSFGRCKVFCRDLNNKIFITAVAGNEEIPDQIHRILAGELDRQLVFPDGIIPQLGAVLRPDIIRVRDVRPEYRCLFDAEFRSQI
jgi:hypothetical protein